MKVLKITTSNGIGDIKLIAETASEQAFINQIVNAGGLVAISNNNGSTATFRPASIMEEDFSSSEVTAANSIGTYNFEIRQNEVLKFDLQFKSDGAPLNLQGYDRIVLQVKKGKNGPAVLSLSVGDGLTVAGASHDILSVAFSAANTAKLSYPQYHYDVLLVTGTTNIYYVEGVITVLNSVSR